MRVVAFIASLVGLAASGYLTHVHIRGTSESGGLCDALSETGCSIAVESSFGSLLGVPLAVFALGAYAALLIAAWRGFGEGQQRGWATVGALLSLGGVASGLFLLGVMAQARAYCPMCITMDVCNVALAVVWVPRAFRQDGPVLAAQPTLTVGVTAALVIGLAQGLYLGLATPAVAEVVVPPPPATSTGLTVEQCSDVELSALEISDFLCPYCKRLESNLSGLLSSCGARVDKRFVHFPLDSSCNRFVSRDLHPGACRLAEAAECARLQGKFTPFAAGLFATTPRDDASLFALAKRKELDLPAFKQCLEARTTADRVRTDIELAHRLGVRSTPTFYLNGRRLEGALSRERLEAEIARALQKDEREARAIQSHAPDPDAEAGFSSEPAEACDGERYSVEQNGCAVPD